ncbi:hypothetical protein HDV62DRAFT_362255 [Trichoderma sp. SZMC 28011]
MKLDDFVVCQLQTSFSIAHLFYFNHLLYSYTTCEYFYSAPPTPFILSRVLSSLLSYLTLLCSILVPSSSPFFLPRGFSPSYSVVFAHFLAAGHPGPALQVNPFFPTPADVPNCHLSYPRACAVDRKTQL